MAAVAGSSVSKGVGRVVAEQIELPADPDPDPGDGDVIAIIQYPRASKRMIRSAPGYGCKRYREADVDLQPLCPTIALYVPLLEIHMQLSRANLADFVYFLAIARNQSFSRAGLELDISASALSHAIKGLEARLGVRLLNRTTRSVTLTAAGEELHALISKPIEEIDQAMHVLNRFRDEPTGRVRLNVLSDAADLLLGPVLPIFNDRYPEMEIDLTVTNRMIDVIGGGHDAGIRYGGTVPEDMIAQRLSPDIRWVVAGTADYLQRFGVPQHPEDLMSHRCLRIRLGNDRMYEWEFEKGDEQLAIAVPGVITIDETRIGVSLLRHGAGLMYAPEPVLKPLIESGQVIRILDDWASVAPGFHMYYSSHRQLPMGLRLLIDLIRELQPMGE